ncbi:NADP-dependent oxidoreductase [Streptomyces albidoflavus]|uniref:NADP-dependent oxidoreductase n=1 Tax=Streptomyces TaxID=1883 RepID=UPI000249389D|nr:MULTISPECIES: NADP-dependent oxidoreductase [Streptomyces]RZD88811.1 NADP-dependent oxidoreductase [Streptomyces albidoflavus]RZD90977.1 NADP-dependent oxidoreductase [Streptomyces albidoflavus]RZE04470.1 NADP-dependent oxidoreductase [Streptomyces albidoflavus]RZE08735.1 NADP-dependent oxidoreductase [Streptomyces albidoflavus]RZE10747.1 NADP-dependent oxidoreductase [Streptomyces albidoflavus]
MRAIIQESYGGPEVLHETRVPRPEPGPGEILVAVRAAGVNPTDWKHRAQAGFVDRLPLVLGWDVSGVVEAVGYGVTLFAPGEEVFGMLPYPHGSGSHAEYVVGPARAFTRKPTVIDHVQAGALPLVSLTAYQALIDTAGIGPGQRVLIHAAAGGVGHVAVQIAKAHGAYVIGTASAPKHDLLRELGADEVVDYRTTDVADAVDGVDMVLDPLGGETRARSVGLLRPGGTLVSLLSGGSAEEAAHAAERGVRTATMLVEADHAGMNAVADLVAAGALRPRVEATFPLAEAAAAHRLGETGRTTGKIVLEVD